MNTFETIPIKDIPDNFAEELKRMHEILKGGLAQFDRDQKLWAQKRIDIIHQVVLCGPIFLNNEDTSL